MKSFTEYLKIKTKNRIDFINITEQVKQVVKKSKIKEGIVLVNPMHIT